MLSAVLTVFLPLTKANGVCEESFQIVFSSTADHAAFSVYFIYNAVEKLVVLCMNKYYV